MAPSPSKSPSRNNKTDKEVAAKKDTKAKGGKKQQQGKKTQRRRSNRQKNKQEKEISNVGKGINLDEKMKAVEDIHDEKDKEDPTNSGKPDRDGSELDEMNPEGYDENEGDEEEYDSRGEVDEEMDEEEQEPDIKNLATRSNDRSFALLAAGTLQDTEDMEDDDMDEKSVKTTKTSTPARKLVRLFLSLRVYPNNKQTRFLLRFVKDANKFLSACRSVCEEFRIAPWNATDPSDKASIEESIQEVEPSVSFHRKYFWAGVAKNKQKNISPINGVKWLRINALLPYDLDILNFINDLEHHCNVEWWEQWDNYICVTPCQAPDPISIGWFLRSNEMLVNTDDFQNVLRLATGDHALGLEWKDIPTEAQGGAVRQNMRKPRKKQSPAAYWKNKVEALLIECSKSKEKTVMAELDRRYNMEQDYIMGISMAFIHSLNHKDMRPSYRRDGYKKCMLHQRLFLEMIDSVEVPLRNLDYFMPKPYQSRTLRQFLTDSLISTLPEFIGDNIYLAVNCFVEDGNEDEEMVSLVYHKMVEDEALSIATNLPLFLQTEYNVDPNLFFTPDVVIGSCRGKSWDPQTRRPTYSNGTDILSNALGEDGDKFLQMDGEDEEETDEMVQEKRQVDLIHKVIYARAQARCEETIVQGRDNTAKRGVVSMTGRQLNLDHADDGSITSGLSENSTGTMGSKGSVKSSETTQSTRNAAAAHATNKAKTKYEALMAKQQESFERAISMKDTTIDNLSSQVAKMQENHNALLERLSLLNLPTRPPPDYVPPRQSPTQVPPTPLPPSQLPPTDMTPGPGSAKDGAVAH